MFWRSDKPFRREAYDGLKDRVLTALEFATLGAYVEDGPNGARSEPAQGDAAERETPPGAAGDPAPARRAGVSSVPAKAQAPACRAMRRANRPPAQAHVEVTSAAVTCTEPAADRHSECSARRCHEARPVTRDERLRKGIRRQRSGTVPVPEQPCVWQQP